MLSKRVLECGVLMTLHAAHAPQHTHKMMTAAAAICSAVSIQSDHVYTCTAAAILHGVFYVTTVGTLSLPA